MKKICWLATGGTIASRPTTKGLAPGFTAQEMMQLISKKNDYSNVEFTCKDIMKLDSTNLTPKDWQFMASEIEKLYDKFDAFIITHGTDTLTWTSCALSCMLEDLAKSVIIVGSQLTIEEENTDAIANLNMAISLAQKNYSGVFVVCGGEVSEGLWAKKLYSEDLRSIQSVNKQAIANYDMHNLNKIVWHDYTTKIPTGKFKVHYELETKIAQVKMMPGFDSKILYTLADLGYKGIVIESYGAGGIPFIHSDNLKDKSIIQAIEDLIAKNIVVVCTTQCVYDGVKMNRYEVGVRASNSGVIPAGKLSTESASVKLMVALGRKDTLAKIKKDFATIS